MGAGRAVAIGAGLGLAWAVSFRAWMTHLQFDFFKSWPVYTWKGTFLSVVLPAVLVGALLGYDWQRRRLDQPRIPLVVWSPLLMAILPALLAEDFIGTLMENGMGSGAIVIVLIGMGGGFAISGRGPAWLRLVVGLVFLGVLMAMAVGFYFWDRSLSASGGFGAVYLVVLLVSLSIGFSVPMKTMSTKTHSGTRAVHSSQRMS